MIFFSVIFPFGFCCKSEYKSKKDEEMRCSSLESVCVLWLTFMIYVTKIADCPFNAKVVNVGVFSNI